jgi:hypothetical protein
MTTKLLSEKEGVTELSSPNQIIDTINGDMRYDQWCESLVCRINLVNPAREAEIGHDNNYRIQVVAYNYDLPRY